VHSTGRARDAFFEPQLLRNLCQRDCLGPSRDPAATAYVGVRLFGSGLGAAGNSLSNDRMKGRAARYKIFDMHLSQV
jgi:hypothetical protein